jgi:hypothetical protein
MLDPGSCARVFSQRCWRSDPGARGPSRGPSRVPCRRWMIATRCGRIGPACARRACAARAQAAAPAAAHQTAPRRVPDPGDERARGALRSPLRAPARSGSRKPLPEPDTDVWAALDAPISISLRAGASAPRGPGPPALPVAPPALTAPVRAESLLRIERSIAAAEAKVEAARFEEALARVARARADLAALPPGRDHAACAAPERSQRQPRWRAAAATGARLPSLACSRRASRSTRAPRQAAASARRCARSGAAP